MKDSAANLPLKLPGAHPFQLHDRAVLQLPATKENAGNYCNLLQLETNQNLFSLVGTASQPRILGVETV